MCLARRSGYTLAEVLVASFLSFLLVGVLGAVLGWLLPSTQRGFERVEMSQLSLRIGRQLGMDLLGVPPRGVHLQQPAGQVVAGLQRVDQISSDGLPSFDTNWIVYQWSAEDHNFCRRTPAPAPLGALNPDLLAWAALPDPAMRVLAHGVTGLNITLSGPLVQVDLELERPGVGPGGKERAHFALQQTLPNN